jgi:preprotein translocase subunit SecG
MDAYTALGAAPSASQDALRRAYRAAAKRWHPDRPGGDAARFAAAADAYEILRDPARRAAYDREHLGQPRLSPAALDLGRLAADARVLRTVLVTNDGAGEPELRLDGDRGTGWRVVSAAGSTAPGAGVTLTLEVDAASAPGANVDEGLGVSLGSNTARLAIRFSVAVPEPAPGAWRPAAAGSAPGLRPGTDLPGWRSVLAQPRWRLVTISLVVGAVVPLALLSNQDPGTAVLAALLAGALALGVGVVLLRTEAFDPLVLASCGPGDQAGVLTVTGLGAVLAVVVAVAVVLAFLIAIVVGAALLAALRES